MTERKTQGFIIDENIYSELSNFLHGLGFTVEVVHAGETINTMVEGLGNYDVRVESGFIGLIITTNSDENLEKFLAKLGQLENRQRV